MVLDSGLRKQALLARLATCAAIVALVAGCAGPDPSLTFLQSQPENGLVYPGASLVSTATNAGSQFVNTCCEINRKFSSSATGKAIVDWYSAQLAQWDWAPYLVDHTDGDGNGSSSWSKPALDLYLDISPPAGGVTSYVVSYQSRSGEYVLAPQLEGLRHSGEASLAPAGATKPRGPDFTIDLGTGGGGHIEMIQDYRLDLPEAQLLDYYGNALLARGWTPATPVATDNPHGVAAGKWVKGPVAALLGIGSDTYSFELSDAIDSAGSPVPVGSTSA